MVSGNLKDKMVELTSKNTRRARSVSVARLYKEKWCQFTGFRA
jgi:hypothetical protein